MSRKRATYILSNVNKAMAFEWIVDGLKDSFEFHFILLQKEKETPLSLFLLENEIKTDIVYLGDRWTYPKILMQLVSILLFNPTKVVHTHLFEASLLGLLAAKIVRVPNRIYTRHHSTYHHDFFPKAVKYDRFINQLSTKVIAISNNVSSVLEKIEGIGTDKIVKIEHGFDIDAFANPEIEKVIALQERHGIPKEKQVLGIIARYVEWKGIEYGIRAFADLIQERDDLHLLIANAGGPYSNVIQSELEKLPKGSYTIIKFEDDLFSLYRCFSYFIHTPINSSVEAFGQTYVEALAAGIPSVFTLSGIANDFIKNEENALIVPYKNSLEIKSSIKKMMADSELKKKIIEGGKKSVENFRLEVMLGKLKTLYLQNQ